MRGSGGATTLGTKTEVKNLNSFSNVERALAAEFARQCGLLLSAGGRVEQQTMLWDAAHGTVRPARSKEESHDYRYFPEPDLPPLVVSPAWVADVRANAARVARRAPRALRDASTAWERATLRAADRQAARRATTSRRWPPRTATRRRRPTGSWVRCSPRSTPDSLDISDFPCRPAALAGLLALVRDGTVSHAAAKTVFAEMVASGEPAAAVAQRLGVTQVGDDTALNRWIDEVMAENPSEA